MFAPPFEFFNLSVSFQALQVYLPASQIAAEPRRCRSYSTEKKHASPRDTVKGNALPGENTAEKREQIALNNTKPANNKYGKQEVSCVGALIAIAGALFMFVFPMVKDPMIALVLYIIA